MFKIGDIVGVINSEQRYTTHYTWFNKNPNIKRKYVIRYAFDDNLSSYFFNDRQFKVVGIDESGEYNDICLIKDNSHPLQTSYSTFLFRVDALQLIQDTDEDEL